MTPFQLATAIPTQVRKVIYGVLATVFTVEVALDAFDYGLIPSKPQAAIFAVLGALGFGMALPNTPTPTVDS